LVGIYNNYSEIKMSKFSVVHCRVEALLKRRAVEAQATSEVYLFVAEFLQLVSDSHAFQVSVYFDGNFVNQHQ